MNEIGAYEAKTHFSALLQRVKRGERFYITHHGVRLAALTPVDGEKTHPIQEVIDQIKTFRCKHSAGVSFKELIEEGRE
ncbi:MAG: type II toxin-antitoxin system prevent-host-death family antitoxin [Anaerolineales bacterium]|jgi:prevent-host-death family protein|nr:type II toxin-antitoxin system prevent-host-death family antitoxin [Anaerolineales bacterium]